MQMSKKAYRLGKDHRGATAVMVAIVLTVLIGIAALAVDVGYLYATRNELQNISDAAALAGAGYLGSTYANLSYQEQQTYVFDRTAVVSVVQQVAAKNRAGQQNIVINDADVVIGLWNGTTVDPTLTTPDAVQVTARRDGNANTPVGTFFANIWGINTVNVSTDATAALSGPMSIPPPPDGGLKTPFSLSENAFLKPCTEEIVFSPTADSCAGWHNFLDQANANNMEEKMLGLIKGDGDGSEGNECLVQPCGQDWLDAHFNMSKQVDAESSEGAKVGDDFDHQGGNVASLFLGGVLDTTYDGAYGGAVLGNDKKPAPFPALFDYFRYRDDDNNNSEWTATIPVYRDGETCTNPAGPIEIVGFTKIIVKMPNPPPDTSVSVWIDCNQSFEPGRSGGGLFGNLKGTIPNLVE